MKLDDSSGPATSSLSRRHFIRFAGIGIATTAAACGGDDETNPPPEEKLEPGDAFFPQSVASGEPRPDSVVLWTRILDEDGGAGLSLTLRVATDEAFSDVLTEQDLLATEDYDHVIKLRMSGLEAGKYYYYRFIYEKDGTRYTSRVGRTKTAPAADADVPVKFAFVSCQDYEGRYYHSYAKMVDLADELDFFVHLGDYIYETTGDPAFQRTGGERTVVFEDPSSAIPFYDEDGEITHYAAQSLGNYRDLYTIYRSDPDLQAVHELLPMVSIWDDHEFSDDCYGDNATYFDGTIDETGELDRRKAAERAHFEYMPLSLGLSSDGAAVSVGEAVPIADPSTVLYRDLRFGKHLHLIVTDTRTYRPDHAMAEDAFFATILMTEAELTAAGEDPMELDADNNPVFVQYVDIDDAAYAAHKTELLGVVAANYETAANGDWDSAQAQAKAQEVVTGNLAAAAVNKLLSAAITAGTLTAIDLTGLPFGLDVDRLRFTKERYFALDGVHARYLLNERFFQLWVHHRFTSGDGSQDIMGATQETWFLDTLQGTDATWKVVGNSISMTPMIIDVREQSFPASLVGDPDEDLIKEGMGLFRGFFNERFLFVLDQWDGFPDKRAQVLGAMREVENVVCIAGDIHSSYVTDHGKGTGSFNVYELVCQGISSEPFKGFVKGRVDGVVPGASQIPSVVALIGKLEDFLMAAEPSIVAASNDTHGFTVVEVGAGELTATQWFAEESHTLTPAETHEAAVAPFQSRSWVIAGNAISEA
ncbi:MAG: alkaline phosphatase D family protein [Myxococcales bacterium]|nr:alkaline phosphatase D family protein [Myxococcales bacterium]